MGWAERSKKEKNFEFQCTKCYGTGIRGYRLDPIKRTKTPIQCKCKMKKDSPVSQPAEEADLESV